MINQATIVKLKPKKKPALSQEEKEFVQLVAKALVRMTLKTYQDAKNDSEKDEEIFPAKEREPVKKRDCETLVSMKYL